MSKKSKRLEKENDTLKRQKDVTAANVIRMAEERQDWKKKIDRSDKKAEKLRLRFSASETKTKKLMSIIQQMQQQGRKLPAGMESTLESYLQGEEEDDDGEESDYSDEEDGEGDGDGEVSEFDDDDDDTEEEPQPSEQGPRVPYGPERPPAAVNAATNGH